MQTQGQQQKDLWLRSDERQQTCLGILIATSSADADHIVQHSNLDKNIARRTLQTLLRRDLVRRNNDDSYSIAAPIFSQWIRNNLNRPSKQLREIW